jgi:glycosyltransferase involved in cell wall biosynthesis
MENRLDCLIWTDCLPWEKQYFCSLVEALGSSRDVRVVSDPALLRPKTPLWLIARDWRRAVASVPRSKNKEMFISVLGVIPSADWWTLLRRSSSRPRENLKVLAHSPFLARFFSEMEKLPSSQVFELYLPGLLLPPRPPRQGPLQIGYLSPLTPDANLGFLAGVAHYVARLGLPVEFRVPSQGPLQAHLRKMERDLDLPRIFHSLEGSVRSLDLLLLSPIKAESFVSLLHSASHGVPVLAADLPGVQSYIQDGHTGFIVPVNEVKPTGEMIRSFCSNPEMGFSFGAKLRLSLAKRFALDGWVREFEGVLNRGATA